MGFLYVKQPFFYQKWGVYYGSFNKERNNENGKGK